MTRYETLVARVQELLRARIALAKLRAGRNITRAEARALANRA